MLQHSSRSEHRCTFLVSTHARTAMPITLDKETSNRALSSLRRYCSEELDLELRDLPAQLLLEFILEEIGPSIYNSALGDAQSFLRDRVADLEDACHQHEFGYWDQRARKRGSR